MTVLIVPRTDVNATQLFIQEPLFQSRLHSKLAYQLDQKALFDAIDADPALVGAGVVYVDSRYTIVELRPFKPICSVKPIKIVLREPPMPTPSLEYAADIVSRPRESRLVLEAISTGLSCGAAVLGWIVVFGSGASVPITGGGSALLTTLGITAATASSLQCLNSAYRTRNEISSPSVNDQLEGEDWYVNATVALDFISLGGAAAAGALTIKSIKMLSSQGLTVREALRGLNRTQRRRLTEEIIRLNQPGASNRMVKYLQHSGLYPKRFTNTELQRATILQIKDAVGGVFSFTGSAVNGVVRNLAVGVYEVTE